MSQALPIPIHTPRQFADFEKDPRCLPINYLHQTFLMHKKPRTGNPSVLSAKHSADHFMKRIGLAFETIKNKQGGYDMVRVYSHSFVSPEIDALIETITQELLRLVIPGQPKTAVVLNTTTTEGDGHVKYWTRSKGIPNFRVFNKQDDVLEAVIRGKRPGFGEACVLAWFVDNNDFKPNNLGVGSFGSEQRIFTLDGELGFGHLHFDRENAIYDDIGSIALTYLPRPMACHEPFNWVGYRVRSQDVPQDNCEFDQLIMSKPFHLEVNQAILKILLLSDEMLEKFINRYVVENIRIPDEEEFGDGKNVPLRQFLLQTLIRRRDKLQTAALANSYFCNFLASSAASDCLSTTLTYWQDFHTTGRLGLNLQPGQKPTLDIDERVIRATFESLLSEIPSERLCAIMGGDVVTEISSLYWLAATPKGREILASNQSLIGMITKEVLCSVVQSGEYTGTSTLNWLAATPKGREILTRNPSLIDMITPEALCDVRQSGNNYVMSDLFQLLTSVEGFRMPAHVTEVFSNPAWQARLQDALANINSETLERALLMKLCKNADELRDNIRLIAPASEESFFQRLRGIVNSSKWRHFNIPGFSSGALPSSLSVPISITFFPIPSSNQGLPVNCRNETIESNTPPLCPSRGFENT